MNVKGRRRGRGTGPAGFASPHSRNECCPFRYFLLRQDGANAPEPGYSSGYPRQNTMKFTGTKDYVATDDLKIAVNAAIVLERPLLVKGEPGTGKTVLAEEVAKAIGAPLLT